MGRFGPWLDMELSLFAPPDLTAMVRLHDNGFDARSEHEAVNIYLGKHYETEVAMDSLQQLNVQPKFLKSIRKVKLRRLDDYKHAFIQFLSKRLSLSRSSPQISFHKMENNLKDANLITNSLQKKIEFNIPVINLNAIQYEKQSDFYSISTYSKMSKCVWLGTKVTLRKMLPDMTTKDGLCTLKAEVHVLGQIRHPYILLLLATTYDDKHNLMLLYENVDYGSLFVYLHEELRSPSEDFILSVLDQMAQVLVFLHQSKWIHTNLTSHAIQVMSCHHFKLSCFELATNTHSKTETNPQSKKIRNHLYNWQAPEYFAGLSLGEYTDIFQFGLLTWEIIERRIPWIGVSHQELKEKYCGNKQAITLNSEKTLPQLITIMDQSLNSNPEDRRLTLEAALKIISGAKSSLDGVKGSRSHVASSKEMHKKCNSQITEEIPSVKVQHSDKGANPDGTIQNPRKKQSAANNLPPRDETRSNSVDVLEDVQESIDSFTGLRRVSGSNIKTYYTWTMKENLGWHKRFSGSEESAHCHSSKKLVNDEWNTGDSTRCQKENSYRSCRSISSSNYLNSMSSSIKALPLKQGTTSSLGIKPASHSIEKQLSSSSSQEFSWQSGSSTPYCANAIKPASHQSERGFPRSHKKIADEVSEASVIYANNRNNCLSLTCKYNSEENQSNIMRKNPCMPSHWSEAKHHRGEYQHNPKNASKDTKLLKDRLSKTGRYPSLLPKGAGEISEENNLNHNYEKALIQKHRCPSPKHEKGIQSHLRCEGGPDVITKICEQLLIMINDPHAAKKENDALGIMSCDTDKCIKNTQHAVRDCYLKIPIITDVRMGKLEQPLSQPKRPSSKFLKILGLNLMEFYQDDELGPSLWNDENMQLGMYQEFGKSLETLINIEEFSGDQHNEIFLRSEEINIESDPELKSKCQFNALYYTLSQKIDEECTSRKEE